MLSFVRPAAHVDFATEGQKLLSDVRRLVEGRNGQPHSTDFDRRDCWSGSWKGDGRHKKILAGLGKSLAKCAFCERIRDVNRELDVEHYRPKVKVTRWEGQPHPLSTEPPKQVDIGPGYWWLTFSWDNYSLACKECNGGWKRNLFPVVEPRAACVEGVEHVEQPLLLDPSKPFRTRDHFLWTASGTMEGVSPEGRATIITCGLNRKNLVALRVKLLPTLLRVRQDLPRLLRDGALAVVQRRFRELAALGSREAEFTGMVRWFTEDMLGCDWDDLEGMPE